MVGGKRKRMSETHKQKRRQDIKRDAKKLKRDIMLVLGSNMENCANASQSTAQNKSMIVFKSNQENTLFTFLSYFTVFGLHPRITFTERHTHTRTHARTSLAICILIK